ncbi:MAG: RNA polymerase subunit sigma-70 [Thermodesulfobacteriota bacterium]
MESTMNKFRNLATAFVLLALPAAAAAFPGHGDPAELEAVRSEVFGEADQNGDGSLDATEFVTFHELLRSRMEEKLFARLDADGSGGVTLAELEAHKGRKGRRGQR